MLSENGINFALSMTNAGIDFLNDTTYMTLQMNQVNQIWTKDANGNANFVRTKIPMTYQKWGFKFGDADQATVRAKPNI